MRRLVALTGCFPPSGYRQSPIPPALRHLHLTALPQEAGPMRNPGYASARLPTTVHEGLALASSPSGPLPCGARAVAGSLGSRAPRGHPVSLHAWGLRLRRIGRALAFFLCTAAWPSDGLTPWASWNTVFGTQYPAYRYPCPTLPVQPRDCPRMARGQDGSLFLPCTTLAFATPRRFIPTPSRPGGLPHEFCRITHTGKSMRHCAKACATRGQEASTRPAPVSPQRGRGRTLHRAPCARARRRTPSPISPPR